MKSHIESTLTKYVQNTSGEYVNTTGGGSATIVYDYVLSGYDSDDWDIPGITLASNLKEKSGRCTTNGDPWTNRWRSKITATPLYGFSFSKFEGSYSNGSSWVSVTKTANPYIQDDIITTDSGIWGTSYINLGVYFSRNKYDVKFNANSGIVAEETRSVYYNASVGTLPTPVRSGYQFDGWYTAASGGNKIETSTTITASVTYYAHWTVNSCYVYLYPISGSIPSTTGWDGSGSLASKDAHAFESYGTLPTPTRTGYKFLGWRKNLLNIYEFADFINSKTDRTNMNYVTFSDKSVLNMEPSQNYHLVNGEQQAYLFQVNLPVPGQYRLSYYAYNDRSDTNIAGAFRIATNGSTVTAVGTEDNYINSQTRKKYSGVYNVTTAGEVGVYFSWHYAGMCHLDTIMLELITPTSGSWPSSAFATSTTKHIASELLYAQWQINTYTLHINYYSGATNSTKLTTTAESCYVADDTLSPPSSTSNYTFTYVTHTYSTEAQAIVFKLSNADSSYYFKIGSAPTTSSYNEIFTLSTDSYTYNWTPTANATINVFVYQRFTISYNSNNGSGTLPSTQYKIFGSSITLGTNSLTKTGYVTNGWNTKSDRSGTSYASGATYSANSNLTLYANWTPQTCTVTVRIRTSSDGSTYTSSSTGGTIKMSYYVDNKNFPSLQNNTSSSEAMSVSTVLINRLVTFAATANSGYVFAGMSTSMTAPYSTTNMSFTPSNSGSTYIYYAYFNKLSGNIVKYIGKNSATYSSVTVRTLSAYSFVQNSAGFYESQNFGSHSSYALASVSFTLTNTADVVFSAISYGENNYDFGIFSNLNSTLTSSYSEDTSNVKQSFKGKSSSAVQRVVYANVSPGSYYVYVKYRKDTSTNYGNDSLQFKLETELSDDSYFYFEDGYFPQSYVGDTLNSTLNNASSSSLTLDRNLKYLNASGTTTSLPIYTYSGNKYAKVTNNGKTKWFKMEPIKWRLSDYDGNVNSTYIGRGKFVKNMKVVSDRALWVGAISRESTKEGWSFNSSSMRTNFKEIYQKNGATVSTETPTYAATYNEKYYYYGPAGQQEKVKYSTTSYTGIDIATEEEIKANLTDLRAKASDMVAFILGLDDDSYCDYWTRELGGSLKNAKMITKSGMTASAWLQNFYGVRFSLRMSEGNRI